MLVCGSTVEDEEPPLLKAFENVRVSHPRAVMILAPRHPERFDTVAILIRRMGIRFRAVRYGRRSLSAEVSSSWIPSENWLRSMRWPTWHSSAAAWYRAADTTSSSRRNTASPS